MLRRLMSCNHIMPRNQVVCRTFYGGRQSGVSVLRHNVPNRDRRTSQRLKRSTLANDSLSRTGVFCYVNDSGRELVVDITRGGFNEGWLVGLGCLRIGLGW